MNNPQTMIEWQIAVDLFVALLCLDSAKQYGLVTGGPAVNADRCVEILDEGEKRGIYPNKNSIKKFLDEFQAQFEKTEA